MYKLFRVLITTIKSFTAGLSDFNQSTGFRSHLKNKDLNPMTTYSNSTFSYSENDFVFVTSSTVIEKKCGDIVETEFDKRLQDKWNFALENGNTRYKLDDLRSKCLAGKYLFLCQRNENRASNRRTPQDMTSIDMPFNPENFNFNKVREEEILFRILPEWNKSKKEHLILVNASPFEYGNSLLVPFVRDCLPQVLKEEGIRLLLEIMLLSGNPTFRAGFNGLTAQASVNHFHFHVYFLKHQLYLETAKVRKLLLNCYEIVDYPAQGFAFQITKLEEISEVTKSLMCLVRYFMKNSVAHNMFVTRGLSFDDEVQDNYKALRIYIWARKATVGQKPVSVKPFVPACIELAGHIPVKDDATFDSICEEEVASQLRGACADNFQELKEKIGLILREK